MKQQKYETFGNYILLEKMASGGMAEIYLAKKNGASGVQKFVAFKRILAEHATSQEFIRMFKDEAKIAVNLSHSNVVSIYDFGAEKDQLYLVMDYVEGKNLRQILNKLKKTNKHLAISHIVYITKMIAAGLDHAHRCIEASTGNPLNIIHRDMSPQNVMVSYEGEVKIIDFGIAKASSQAETTRVGTLKGKFGYMSPEQVEGHTVDTRTDLFALGIMTWEMLTERRLFLTNNEMGTLRKIRDCEVPPLREIDPNIPAELEKIVNKALAKNRNHRYQTAAELQKDLQSFLNRYSPDFSSQDFSEFVKELYASEIIEARKRRIQYAKIEAYVEEPRAEDNEPTIAMNTQTYSPNDSEAASLNFDHLSIKERSLSKQEPFRPTDDSVSLNQKAFLEAKQKVSGGGSQHPQSPPPPNHQNGGLSTIPAHNEQNSHYTYSQPGLGVRIPDRKSGSPIGALFLLFFSILITGFAMTNHLRPQMVAKPCRLLKAQGLPLQCYQGANSSVASKEATIMVTSKPSGAFVFLNSKLTGQQTPAQVKVDPSKPFLVSVSLGGYKGKGRQFKELPKDQKTHFNLASVPTGWIVVRVVGGQAFYEGKAVKNGEKIAVEANKLITLKAKNPVTNKQVTQNVMVQEGETQSVLLAPH